jgi:hypothetical protein
MLVVVEPDLAIRQSQENAIDELWLIFERRHGGDGRGLAGLPHAFTLKRWRVV